jgi:hypothetical protein
MKKSNWPLPVIFVILSSTSEHRRATHKMSVHKQELTSIMQKTKNMVILNISLAPCQLYILLTGSQCETIHQTSEHNYIKFLTIMCVPPFYKHISSAHLLSMTWPTSSWFYWCAVEWPLQFCLPYKFHICETIRRNLPNHTSWQAYQRECRALQVVLRTPPIIITN